MYKDGELTDDGIHANLDEVVAGEKPGREADDERVYFNAVGLAFVDVAIALAMYRRGVGAGEGRGDTMQGTKIFPHPNLSQYGRWGSRGGRPPDPPPAAGAGGG